MSGGVDSSVTAALLVEAGHCVFGFTMRLFDAEEPDPQPATDNITAAASVCDSLNIPHYVLDLRSEFRIRDHWITLSANTWLDALLIPVSHCHARNKWGRIWEKAQAYGIVAYRNRPLRATGF
jgi:tRNA-specific 2-thiouridylase